MGADSELFFPEDVVKAVSAALESYWDASFTAVIPQRYIAITSAFLEATGALPDSWYQGAKARNVVMPTLYKAWVTFFRKYAAIVSGIGGIDEVTEKNALLAKGL
jgi:hypothetical protein